MVMTATQSADSVRRAYLARAACRGKENEMKQYAPGKEPQYSREDDKLHPEEIELKGGVVGKLDNFWFYHKWKVIVSLASIVLVLIMCLQMCGNQKDDLTFMYAGSAYLTTVPNYTQMLTVFEDVMPEDYNGDGNKRVECAALNIYSEEQIKKRKAEIASGKDLPEYNTHINSQEYTSYNRLMQTGEYSLCLIEKWLYDSVADGVFCKLEDTLGYKPDYAIDSYAVYFWDTDFAKANAEIFSAIPKETVLCLRMKNSITNKGSETNYKIAKETFIAIMNYKPE